MIRLQFPAPAMLALLLGAATLLGQQAAAQQEPESASGSAQANETTPAVPDSGDPDDSGKNGQPATPENSPFDYQSSEKISEDLSVSFPVDI